MKLAALTLLFLTTMWTESMAQQNCVPAVMSLSPCLGFISGNSTTPSPSCCTQLASVVQTQAKCLCTVLSGGLPQLLPFAVNQTQALTLPGVCQIQTPPLSQCNAASGTGSPQNSPAAVPPPQSPPSVPSASTPSTPSIQNNPIGSGGSKTVPTTGQTSSAGSSMNFAATSMLFVIFLGSALSIF